VCGAKPILWAVRPRRQDYRSLRAGRQAPSKYSKGHPLDEIVRRGANLVPSTILMGINWAKFTASDYIDLLVVGEVTLEDLLARLADVERSLGRAVNPTVYSATEFKSKLASGNHFLNSVVRGEKVFLIGNEDELREVGGIRLAESRADQSR